MKSNDVRIPGAVEDFSRTALYAKEAAAVEFVLPFLGRGRILDIGCGLGRTSEHLFSTYGLDVLASDVSADVIGAARQIHPGIDFRVMDACDLSCLQDALFDYVLFSFNGIDYIPTVEKRMECLHGVARVLRPGGFFIYSTHNRWGLFFKKDARRILMNNFFPFLRGRQFLRERSKSWDVTLYHGTMEKERAMLEKAGMKLVRAFSQDRRGRVTSGEIAVLMDHWPYYVARKAY